MKSNIKDGQSEYLQDIRIVLRLCRRIRNNGKVGGNAVEAQVFVSVVHWDNYRVVNVET